MTASGKRRDVAVEKIGQALRRPMTLKAEAYDTRNAAWSSGQAAHHPKHPDISPIVQNFAEIKWKVLFGSIADGADGYGGNAQASSRL